MATNKIVGIYLLLTYHKFSEEFIIHIDNIKTHIRGAIIQNGKPIDFYMWKLTPAQIIYTNT